MTKLRWYCGLGVGITSTVNGYDMEDCSTHFETEESDDEIEEGLISVQCPTCGGTLYQSYDEPEIVQR